MSVLFRNSVVVLCLLISSNAHAQQKSDSIPLDPHVHHGVLQNGLTWYIFKNNDPKNITTVSLVEKVGLDHSEKGEEGAAHFIEHLNFRTLRNFPVGLDKFLNSYGLQQNDISAKTGPDRTTYNFKMPGGDSVLLNHGIRLLFDWADPESRPYLPGEVEEERGAVLSENALSNPQFGRGYFLLLDQNPLFESRHGIERKGYESISIETLRAFDRKWYRPDRQAIIIVGDVDEKALEKKIKSVFSVLKHPHNADVLSTDVRKQYDLPLSPKNKVVAVNNGFVRTSVRVDVFQKRKSTTNFAGVSTISQLRSDLADKIYNELAAQRFANVKPPPDTRTGFLMHTIDRRSIHPYAGIDALRTAFEVNDLADVQKVIGFAMKELHRIERWGFTEQEFASAKASVLRSIRRDKVRSSDEIASSLRNHFMDRVAFPEDPTELKTRILESISLADINKMAADWLSQKDSTDVQLTVSDENDPAIPTEKQVFGWINSARMKSVKPYMDKVLKSLPAPPELVEQPIVTSHLEAIDATRIELQNGIKVIIKRIGSAKENPRSEAADVYVTGFRAGGARLFSDENYASASIAATLVRASGVASLSAGEFEDWLANERKTGTLSLNPYLLAEEEGFGGEASLSKSDELFHLIYLFATQPRADKEIFESKLIEHDRPMHKTSNVHLFEDSVLHVMTGSTPKGTNSKPHFKEAFKIYKERFQNANGFTFVITGYFETGEVVKKVQRYLGAWPSSAMQAKPVRSIQKTNTKKAIDQDLRVTMIGDSTGNVSVKILFGGALESTERNRLLSQATSDILNTVFFHRLREQEKGVYSASAGVSTADNQLWLRVSFETAPENVDRLVAAVGDELQKIAKGVVDDDTFRSALGSINDMVSKDLYNPYYINTYIAEQLRKGTMSLEGLNRSEIVRSITKQDVISLIRDSLDRDHYMLFKLL